MLTPDEKFNIIKQSLKDGFKGSVTNLIDSVEKEALNVDKVANTEAEQKQGLRGDTKGQTMAFTNSNEDFNTKGMKYPIDIEKTDEKGNIVRSYKNVPPGIENLPMGDKVGTVIESASEYQMGGQKTAESPQSDPGFKAFMDNVASRMEELEKEFNASGKTFNSPGKHLYQEGGQRKNLVKSRFKIAEGLEDFIGPGSGDLASEHLEPLNTYKTYRSRHFQGGGFDQGETQEDGMFYPNPNLPVMPQVEKEIATRQNLTGKEGEEFSKEVMTGKRFEDGQEVTLGSAVNRYFNKKGYNPNNMFKIMDYIGQHESGDDYTKKQVSQNKTTKEFYDGPGRGRYQFENNYEGGGITAINRTARGVKSLGLAINYKREDGPFANVFDAFYGKYEGQPSKKEIDMSTLSPEEQDFVFIFNYLNGRKKAKSDLISLLQQEDELTSDQIFDFWLNHHKVTTDLGKEEEYKRWNNRTKSLEKPIIDPTKEEENEDLEE